jgi:hypothetical protein
MRENDTSHTDETGMPASSCCSLPAFDCRRPVAKSIALNRKINMHTPQGRGLRVECDAKITVLGAELRASGHA